MGGGLAQGIANALAVGVVVVPIAIIAVAATPIQLIRRDRRASADGREPSWGAVVSTAFMTAVAVFLLTLGVLSAWGVTYGGIVLPGVLIMVLSPGIGVWVAWLTLRPPKAKADPGASPPAA